MERMLILLFLLLGVTSCITSEISVDIADDESFDRELKSLSFSAETRADGSGLKLKNESLDVREGSLEIFAIKRADSGSFIKNFEVEWIVNGGAGSLTVQPDGKSAIFNPVGVGSSKVSFTVNGVKQSVTFNVSNNDEPSLNLITPNGGSNSALVGSNFDIQWSDSDSDDDADISLYYSTSSSGSCSDQTLIVGNLSENSATDNYLWDTTGISDGNYYVCALITDSIGSVQIWNPQVLNIYSNISPSFAFINPSVEIDLLNTDGLVVSWSDSDPEDNANVNLYWKTTNTGLCNTGTLIHSVLENDVTDSYSWDTTSMNSGRYYLCASISDGINPLVEVHSTRVNISRICNWLGNNTNFNDANNWSNCNSVTPQITDFVRLNSTVNDPTISSDVTIYGFAAGGSHEEVTIDTGTRLQVLNSKTFLSSVTFKGSTPTCSDCELRLRDFDNNVLNGSILRLEPGISVLAQRSSINLGDGVTTAHLEIAGGAPENEWIHFKKSGAWGFHGFIFNGTALDKATVSINGAVIEYYNGYSSNESIGINLKNHYEVLQIDNIKFPTIFGDSQTDNFTIENCSNGIFTDSDWSNINFVNSFGNRANNINVAATCTSIPVAGSITMTNASGLGYGSLFENDTNNLITWFNETGGLCEWNGVTSSDWFDPTNWNNCTNGRGNYPDQFNDVFLTSGTPNSPTINSNITINSFDTPGSLGGNTLTIDSGTKIWVSSNNIRSNVEFRGSSDSCSDCVLGSDTFNILNNAEVTLGSGLRVRVRDSWHAFQVGNGTEPGHLVVNPNSVDQNHWVQFQPWSYYNEGIKVRGVDAANRSSLSINGLISPMHSGGNHAIELVEFYEVKKLDNLSIRSAFGWAMTETRVLINNCSGSLFTDTSWDQIEFFSAPEDPITDAFNIEFTNCPALASSLIDITKMSGGTNVGFGQEFSSDPNNSIIWNP